MQIHDRNFTFYGAVQELEARLIEQALELEGGNVARAAETARVKTSDALQHASRQAQETFRQADATDPAPQKHH